MSRITTDKVPFSTRIAFGVGDFGFLLVWQGAALFLMYFYTDVLGITPALAGTIYLIAMVWDAITDPIIATLAERTRTRFGRYRPWIVLGALPFAASYPLAFSSPASLAVTPWLWALLTHIALRTAYTVVSMPFNAMQARLTPDADERTVLAGFRMMGAATGALMIVILTPIGVELFEPEQETKAYFIVACIAGGLAFLALIYCGFVMQEPKDSNDGSAPPATSFLGDLVSMFTLFTKNGALIRVFSIIAIGSICIGMFGKNILYHFKYNVDRPDLITQALVLPAILLILTTPAWVILSKRTSKRRALATGMTIALVGYVLFYLNPSTNISISIASICIIGVGSAALPVMFWAMLPDTIEYGQAKTGLRAEARTFGFAAFAQKAAIGINAMLLGWLLSTSGFEANTDQSDTTLAAMKAIMAVIPAVGAVAILLILRGYNLNQKTHAELLRQTQI